MTDNAEIKLIRISLRLIAKVLFKPNEKFSLTAEKQLHKDYVDLKKLLKNKIRIMNELGKSGI